MHRRRPARAAAALAALALATGVAACSDSTPASTTLPGTTTAAPTTDALPPLGPADFPLPDAARQQTPEGATAFTEYYIGLISFTTTTLDATAIRQLSRNCEVCDQVADGYDRDRVAGYRYEGGLISISSMPAPKFQETTAEFAFLLVQTAVKVIDPQGAALPDRGSPEITLNGGVLLEWDSTVQSWLVTALTADRM